MIFPLTTLNTCSLPQEHPLPGMRKHHSVLSVEVLLWGKMIAANAAIVVRNGFEHS